MLVYKSGDEKIQVPAAMGTPRADQLQGTVYESLIELAGRTCYDSLGRGRNSQEYHKHILEVGHLSVLEHANLCFEAPEYWAEFILGRPGVYITGRENTTYIRFVANFRAIYEWDEWSAWTGSCGGRDHSGLIQSAVAPYSRLIFGQPKYPVAWSEACALKIVEPRTDDERWVTMYLTGSRGFSHELVRHGDFTAISQRSTRYVNENNGAYCYHPLLKELMLKDRALAEEIENVQHREKLVYQQIFEALKEAHGVKQARGAARGVLANALQTEVIFSASVAQWRRMIAMRASEAADGEIREVFLKVKDIIHSLYGETQND